MQNEMGNCASAYLRVLATETILICGTICEDFELSCKAYRI